VVELLRVPFESVTPPIELLVVEPVKRRPALKSMPPMLLLEFETLLMAPMDVPSPTVNDPPAKRAMVAETRPLSRVTPAMILLVPGAVRVPFSRVTPPMELLPVEFVERNTPERVVPELLRFPPLISKVLGIRAFRR
jgi:hypothetical protein